MEIYKKTILNVYTMLFGKINNLNEEMENLIEFETRLAKIMRMRFRIIIHFTISLLNLILSLFSSYSKPNKC
jgi:hypothetical protein